MALNHRWLIWKKGSYWGKKYTKREYFELGTSEEYLLRYLPQIGDGLVDKKPCAKEFFWSKKPSRSDRTLKVPENCGYDPLLQMGILNKRNKSIFLRNFNNFLIVLKNQHVWIIGLQLWVIKLSCGWDFWNL